MAKIDLFLTEQGRVGPLASSLFGVGRLGRLVTSPFAQQIETGKGGLEGDEVGIEGRREILLVLRLRVRLQKLPACQTGLRLRDAVLVRGKEGVVPFLQILGLGEQSLKFGVDDLCYLRSKRLGEAVQSFPEPEELNVKRRVGRINRMGGGQALEGKREFVWTGQ